LSTLPFNEGDFNRDGFVDGADYTLWADHFVPPSTASAAAALNANTAQTSETMQPAIEGVQKLADHSNNADAIDSVAWSVAVDRYFAWTSEAAVALDEGASKPMPRRLRAYVV
jgi:hypothetical protein